jgi:hypothetical protein
MEATSPPPCHRLPERPLSRSGLRLGGLGRAVRPLLLASNGLHVGTEHRARLGEPVRALRANVEASSHEGSGPGTGLCREARARLTPGTPSGAEASSGTGDTCRPWGRGVEKASRPHPWWNSQARPAVRSIHRFSTLQLRLRPRCVSRLQLRHRHRSRTETCPPTTPPTNREVRGRT